MLYRLSPLRNILGPSSWDLRNNSDRLTALRDHIVELARGRITEELSILQQDTSDPNSPERRQRKDSILTQLKRLLPGCTASLSAILQLLAKLLRTLPKWLQH